MCLNLQFSSNDMVTPNRILYFQEVDGLKTGFKDTVGYYFAGTAKQDGKRMLSVVMGNSNGSQRFNKFYIPFL
ncbi:hypothetical protein [Bacillus thuringiensis]|uniref:hypothetical protein n=1 Tax=Bacillus thuringiensis TaxID=1428 RepID=UPI0030C87918